MNKKKVVLVIIIILVIIGIIIGLKFTGNKKFYEIEDIREYKYFLLYENSKMGVIDRTGQVLIEPIYDSIQIPNPSKDVFICLYDYDSQTEDYKTKVLNEKNEEILTKYDKVVSIALNGIASDIPYEKNILLYEENGKYGIIDFQGKVVKNAEYDEIQGLTYKEGELLVKKSEKYGVINNKGIEIIKTNYDSIVADNYYNEENKYKLAGYVVGVKTDVGYNYGYIKYNGDIYLKPEYTSISRITDIKDTDNIYLIVQNKTKVGLIKNKDIVIDFNYKELAYNQENNILTARKNAKSGILDLQGNEIIPLNYDELFINEMYVYTKNADEDKWFNIDGTELQDLKYKKISKVNEGKYFIVLDDKNLYGILNSNKDTIIENKYTYIEYLFNDYFIAYNNGLGVINSKGEKILDFKYDVLTKIGTTNVIQAKMVKNNTLELFSKDINSLGIFKNANVTQKENYIELVCEDKTKYFNFDGKELANTEVFKDNKLFSSNSNGKWGFKDKDENIVVKCVYDEVTEFNEYGFAGIKKDGKWGVIDTEEKIILEPTYELKNISNKPYFIGKYYRVYYGYGSTYYMAENKD